MDKHMTDIADKIKETAQRIRELRLISGISVEEMARRTDTTVEEYIQCEEGNRN